MEQLRIDDPAVQLAAAMDALALFTKYAHQHAERQDLAALLDELTVAGQNLDAARHACVDLLRAQGASWAQVGAALRMSAQGAHKTYRHR